MDETTLSGEATIPLVSCSWCGGDVALGMLYCLKAVCDFRFNYFYFQRLEVIGNPCGGVSEMEWKFTRCHATDVINIKILMKENSNFIVHQISLCGRRFSDCLHIIIIQTSMLAMAVSASVLWTTMTLLSSVLKILSQDYYIWCTIRTSMVHWTSCLAVSTLC